jgi:hypothetical protein
MMRGSFTIRRRGLGRLLTALSYFFSSVFIPATGSMLAAGLVQAEITRESDPSPSSTPEQSPKPDRVSVFEGMLRSETNRVRYG